MLWIKEVEMIESVDDLKSSRSIQGETHFPNYELLYAKIATALNKIVQKLPLKEEGQSGGTESSERGSVPSRKTDRLHDPRQLPVLLALMIQFLITLTYSQLLFAMMMFRNSIRYGMKFFESWNVFSKIPPDDLLESLYKLRICESDQLKTIR